MKKILVVGSGLVGKTALMEMITSKGINDMVIIEAKKEVNPAFEREPILFTNHYKELGELTTFNPNPPKRGSNKQPKRKKRKKRSKKS